MQDPTGDAVGLPGFTSRRTHSPRIPTDIARTTTSNTTITSPIDASITLALYPSQHKPPRV